MAEIFPNVPVSIITERCLELIRHGFNLLGLGNAPKAASSAQLALTYEPDSSEAWFLYAHAAASQGNIISALHFVERAYHILPGDFRYLYNLGRLLKANNRLDDAIFTFEKVLEINSNSVNARIEFADLLRDSGNLRRASVEYRKALLLDPHNSYASQEEARLSNSIDKAAIRFKHYAKNLNAQHRHPSPFVHFTGRPGGPYGKESLDEWGFPNRAPPSIKKDPNETRVFVLGDSTMFNGRCLSETVPALMEKELATRGLKNVKIYNFGVVSSFSMQMVSLLFFKLADYEPDLVIVCNGVTDLFIPITFDPRPGHPYNFYIFEELYSQFFGQSRNANDGLSLSASELMLELASRQTHLRNQVQWGSPAWEKEIVKNYLSSVRKFELISSAYGFKIAILLQPIVAMRDMPTPEEQNCAKKEFVEYLARQLQRIREAIFPHGGSVNIYGKSTYAYDFTGVFRFETNTIFEDFIHYNDLGRFIMANRVADVAQELLDTPARTAGEEAI